MSAAEGYLTWTILHEISHGLGPAWAHVDGKQIAINEAIGPAYSGLEEAKADVAGVYLAKWLIDQKLLPASETNVIYASYVAGIFRTLRFGTGEAHGRAQMMEFNFFVEQGAVRRDASGKYALDFDKMPTAVAALAKELLEIEATGDGARGEAWFKKYGDMPSAVESGSSEDVGHSGGPGSEVQFQG